MLYPAGDGGGGKKKKKKKSFNTLCSKYLFQLGNLADTLRSATPHYVRCVKPNDIHYRPIDGAAAFDNWKTYRQLLYAGVMEVTKIKKEGFPFREDYDFFWKQRCVKEGYDILAKIDKNTPSKDATEALAELVLPKPHDQKQPDGSTITMHYWAMGNTLFFSKDDTLDKLSEWHQKAVAGSIQRWWRYQDYRLKYMDFIWAKTKIVNKWHMTCELRRLAKIEAEAVRAQSMARALQSHKEYAKRRDKLHAIQAIQRAWRPYNHAKQWGVVGYKLSRIEIVRQATEKVQKNWRNYHQYPVYYEAYQKLVKKGGQRLMGVIEDQLKTRMARGLWAVNCHLQLRRACPLFSAPRRRRTRA